MKLIRVPFMAAMVCFLCIMSGVLSAQILTVDETLPIQNAKNVPADLSIVVRFNTALELSTVPDNVIVHGSLSGVRSGTFSYSDGNRTMTFNPAADFFPGEIVSVTLTNAIFNEFGMPLDMARVWTFTVATQHGLGHIISDAQYDCSFGVLDVCRQPKLALEAIQRGRWRAR